MVIDTKMCRVLGVNCMSIWRHLKNTELKFAFNCDDCMGFDTMACVEPCKTGHWYIPKNTPPLKCKDKFYFTTIFTSFFGMIMILTTFLPSKNVLMRSSSNTRFFNSSSLISTGTDRWLQGLLLTWITISYRLLLNGIFIIRGQG